MKNVKTYTGMLDIVKRLPNSRNGNPRFLVKVGETLCYTPIDSFVGYQVQNFDGREVNAAVGTHYGKLTLETIETL